MTMAGDERVRRIVVVGGGTAGWLVACSLAARAATVAAEPIDVTLVESPDVPTIGVGEGTWPTMRRTLAAIGIDEADFLLACDASFKQGSRFDGWRTGSADDRYYHPFVPPVAAEPRDLVAGWNTGGEPRFAETVDASPALRLRERMIMFEQEDALADVLATEAGDTTTRGVVAARAEAARLVGPVRALYRGARTLMLDGASRDEIAVFLAAAAPATLAR